MKTRVSMIAAAMLLLAAVLMAAGCANTKEPQATPMPAVTSTPKAEQPVESATPDVQQPPMTGGVIQNFVEGAVVEIAQLPQEITAAIKKEYADATVKSASYATYENEQMYKVVIQRAEDDATEDVYVTSDGRIIPAKATAASPSPDAGGTEAPAAAAKETK